MLQTWEPHTFKGVALNFLCLRFTNWTRRHGKSANVGARNNYTPVQPGPRHSLLPKSGLNSSASEKYRKFKYLKKFCRIQTVPLEKKCSFPISLAAGCQIGPVRAPAGVRRTAHFHVAQRRMWL